MCNKCCNLFDFIAPESAVLGLYNIQLLKELLTVICIHFFVIFIINLLIFSDVNATSEADGTSGRVTVRLKASIVTRVTDGMRPELEDSRQTHGQYEDHPSSG